MAAYTTSVVSSAFEKDSTSHSENPSYNFTGSAHIYAYGGDWFLRKHVSLTVRQEGTRVLRQPPTGSGDSTVFCEPWAVNTRKKGKGGSLLAVWTWLSFRKIGCMVIKLTNCVRNRTFAFAFQLNPSAALCTSYHEARLTVPSKRASSAVPGREIPLFLSSWSLSGPGGAPRDPHGNRCLRDTIVRSRCYSPYGYWFLFFNFYFKENLLTSYIPKQPWGNTQVSQRERLTRQHKNKPISFLFFSHNFFYSPCFASFSF